MTPRCIEEHPSGAKLYRGQVASDLLKGNLNGMAAERPVMVFTPPGMRDGLPTLYMLAGWMGAGRTAFEWQPFRESLFDRLVRLMTAGAMKPAVVVAPDLYTDHGGSQYIDSAYFGPHGSHIVKDVVPWIESQFAVNRDPMTRGVFGKSSGGFGAVRLALDFPGTFGAVACHSGDLGFEHVYRRSLVDICSALPRYKGDVLAFRQALAQSVKVSGFETHVLMLLGMAGFYAPDAGLPAGYRLPIDWFTGKIDEEQWSLWDAQDPLTMLRAHDAKEALAKVKYLFVDVGNRDQYFIHLGSRQLAAQLKKDGFAVTYQEFDDTHSNTSYRFDVSLPLLAKAISE